LFSLLGDLFPVSQRSAMAALVQIAVGAGIGGGQVGCRFVQPIQLLQEAFTACSIMSEIVCTATTQPLKSSCGDDQSHCGICTKHAPRLCTPQTVLLYLALLLLLLPQLLAGRVGPATNRRVPFVICVCGKSVHWAYG
jgi:hypothetical protein